MKVYDVEKFPNPIRVRMALAEKGATDQVTFVPVDLMKGEHRSAAFTAKNPSAAVPVLELDDGTYISECSAITEYIDHAYDGPSLTGKTPRERAFIAMMQRRAEAMVLDAVGAYFHHATPGLGPELEVNQNQAWGLKQRDVALSGMAYFNKVLEGQTFVVGDVFSIADITLFAGLVFSDFAKIDVPDELSNLKGWRERVAARPSASM
ncbi:MAG: glutathione S-transferase [Myxococcota bacterium]